MMLPLVYAPTQALEPAATALAGTAAQWLWGVPPLPFGGFPIHGALAPVTATDLGPADPSATHDSGHVTDGMPHSDHELDHDHAVTRHRFAGVTSVVGPLVVILSFALSALIFWQYRSLAGDARV